MWRPFLVLDPANAKHQGQLYLMVSGQSSRDSDGKRRRFKGVANLVLLLLLEPKLQHPGIAG